MADPDLTESAWRKAKQDAGRIYPSTEFEVAAALMTIIAGAVAAVASAGENTTTQIAAPIIGGAVALLLTFGVVWFVQLAAAPVRQRDALRAAWSPPEPIQTVDLGLTLRNERRKGDDLVKSLSAGIGYTTSDEKAGEEWTGGVIEILSSHEDPEAAKQFIEASKGVDSFTRQMRARVEALDQIIERLG